MLNFFHGKIPRPPEISFSRFLRMGDNTFRFVQRKRILLAVFLEATLSGMILQLENSREYVRNWVQFTGWHFTCIATELANKCMPGVTFLSTDRMPSSVDRCGEVGIIWEAIQ